MSEKEFEELEELGKKDITLDLIIEAEEEEKEEVEGEKPEIPTESHPAIILLDMAVQQSVEFCKSQKLPPPNMTVYENFSKPFLNKALWYYFPEGNLPDDPKVVLLLGVAGLGLAYIPTIMAFWKKGKKEKKEKPKTEKEELKEKAEKAREEVEAKIDEDLIPLARKLRMDA